MQLDDKPFNVIYMGIDSIVQFGLPLKKALVWHAHNIDLHLDKVKLECAISATGYWEDGSIRWVAVESVIANSGEITLSINDSIETTPIETCINERLASFGDNIVYENQTVPLTAIIELKLVGNTKPINATSIIVDLVTGALTNKYELTGSFEHLNKKLLFMCHIQECITTGEITFEVRLHNPSAAAHVGGKWDLGDENSVIIDEFSVIFECPYKRIQLLLEDEKPTVDRESFENEGFKLTQFGSGGEHWHSPIHWNEHKQSTVHKQGFELIKGNQNTIIGLRADPIVCFDNDDYVITLSLDGFWQNFPVTVSRSNKQCKWQLLAKDTELQGGESKTWKLKCRISQLENINNKVWQKPMPPILKFNTHYINECKILPNITLSSDASKLSKYIDLGLKGPHSFFSKRENKDVYGWRNYGELDADHEAANTQDNTYFISHYNNQYDPLMGMTLQFLHSGDPAWLELVQPLNQHIQDIDIYDTVEDKSEYNGGLMWHTDHYLSAETCTHRSNSKYHKLAYEGFLGGGGPGGQHCYTTGLALQYRLFGDVSAKFKVEQLCIWLRNFYNGGGSIAERTFRLLTIDLKQNVLTNIGIKAPGYKYPLDRGTANYLNALIDCFDVTEDIHLISEMGQLIRNTFHPCENIELRDLKNIENTWFYTVFLQAAVRYLLLKESRQSIDDDYWYVRHGLMHYGEWMVENERFYLSNAEHLEFPNDTWCAQDMRKVVLFCYFYYFNDKGADIYLQKANEFYDYVVKHLSTSNEAHYTRILAILMQHDGVAQKFGLGQKEITPPQSPIGFEEKVFKSIPTYSRRILVATYLRDVAGLLKHFSIKLEWRWLSLRVKSVLNK